MLYRELLSNQIDRRREDFIDFSRKQSRDIARYLRSLGELSLLSSSEIAERFSQNDNVGAVPSSELDSGDSFLISFDQHWDNHEQSRRWAQEILFDRTTFAADASQIMPGRDISMPVAAVQVGWFENPHNESKSYEKNAELILLSPKELLESQDEPIDVESRVGEKRFHAEVDRVKLFLDKHRGWQDRGDRMPAAFFDGTLLVSFSLPKTALQSSFVQKMIELVQLSLETKVPVIGYIDRSLSKDVLRMIESFGGSELKSDQTLYDTALLDGNLSGADHGLRNWGDRTVFCYSKRKGLESFIDNKTGRSLVGFTYLRTSGTGLPARIDVPSWVFEEGLLSELIDVIRAECIVGLGYPYALETADATAVISLGDREIFLAALQEFATREKLDFTVSRKSTSKMRRR